MFKDFRQLTYIVDDNLSDTLTWLLHHQDSFDSFSYDSLKQELTVFHANGADIAKIKFNIAKLIKFNTFP